MDSEDYSHALPESPHTATNSAEDFTAHDADLILRACDGREFRVYRRFLIEASPVFHAMFSIPAPPPGIQATSANVAGGKAGLVARIEAGMVGVGAQGNHILEPAIPIVDIAEDSFVISALLRFIYPLPEPHVSSLATLSLILKAAEKYAMDGTLHSLRRILVSPQNGFLENSPLHVYALAMMYGFKEEAQLASNRAIMNVDFLQLELDQHHELSLISGKDLLSLLQMQQKHINLALTLLTSASVAGPCSGCGSSPYWWREWVKRASEELKKRPTSEIIFSAGFLARSVQGSGCAACPGHYVKQSSQARLESLAEVLARPSQW